MKPRKTTIEFNSRREATPLRVVGDAAIATRVIGDGRLIPVLIVETSERSDIEELVRVHDHLAPGDVEIQWFVWPRDNERVGLLLDFRRPVELKSYIEFNIERQGVLVDSILGARCFYLQPGRRGDRLIHTMDHPRTGIEVPDTGFGLEWERLYLKSLERRLRREGMSRSEARSAALKFLNEWRRFSRFRMR